MQARRRNEVLFARWLFVVYVPLVLLVAGIILWMLGIFPRRAGLLMTALSVWALLAMRLLWERRKKGIKVPAPRSLIVGTILIAAAALSGAILTWMGLDRLSSTSGTVMLYTGGVLILTALLAPAFKALDLAIRAVARRVLHEPTARRSETTAAR